MEMVEISEETRFCWECTCGEFNEEYDDPRSDAMDEHVYCEKCGKEYKAE